MPLSYRTRARLWSLVDSLARVVVILVTVIAVLILTALALGWDLPLMPR